jgi:hypothetical protein
MPEALEFFATHIGDARLHARHAKLELPRLPQLPPAGMGTTTVDRSRSRSALPLRRIAGPEDGRALSPLETVN